MRLDRCPLQAVLAHHDHYEILLAMHLLQAEHLGAVRAAFLPWDTRRFPRDCSSFWMRRKPA